MKIFFEEREKTRQKKAETMETKTEMLFICIADGRIHTLKGSFYSMRKKSICMESNRFGYRIQ